jgi:integrase
MTISLTPAPGAAPATSSGDYLTEDDAARIAAALAATHAENTRKVHAFAWDQWARWCRGRGIAAFPAAPSAVCAYLTERADHGVSLSIIDLACSAIGHQHRHQHHGRPDPIDHDAVRQVRRGLRRDHRHGATPPSRSATLRGRAARSSSPSSAGTPQGARDAALILVGFAGALRRSELAALTLADVEAKPAGLLLHLRRSKTDPERRGQVVGIAHGQHARTDPIGALDAWLTVRGTAPGPVFTSLRPGITTLQPISGSAVTRIVKDRAADAGLGAERITAHSLRAGHATSAALAGVGVERIAAQTRHRRIDVLVERYIRPVLALQTTSSKDLGL